MARALSPTMRSLLRAALLLVVVAASLAGCGDAPLPPRADPSVADWLARWDRQLGGPGRGTEPTYELMFDAYRLARFAAGRGDHREAIAILLTGHRAMAAQGFHGVDHLSPAIDAALAAGAIDAGEARRLAAELAALLADRPSPPVALAHDLVHVAAVEARRGAPLHVVLDSAALARALLAGNRRAHLGRGDDLRQTSCPAAVDRETCAALPAMLDRIRESSASLGRTQARLVAHAVLPGRN
jgi:hypothetical protein